MARVSLYHQPKGEAPQLIRSRSMMQPVNVTSLASWFRSAMITLPQIPNPTISREWDISHAVATLDTIVFELHSIYGLEKRQIVINRRADSMGF